MSAADFPTILSESATGGNGSCGSSAVVLGSESHRPTFWLSDLPLRDDARSRVFAGETERAGCLLTGAGFESLFKTDRLGAIVLGRCRNAEGTGQRG